MTATALWITGPRRVESRAIEVPPPGPNEVVVESRVSAISAGTELLLYRDEVPDHLPADDTLEALDGDLSYPRRYGYAAVGDVVETGSEVPRSWSGQRVFAFHPHQTRFTVRVDDVVPVPDDLPTETAALLPFMETAVTLVLDANPRLAERVVVHGAGAIGLCTINLLGQFPLDDLVAVEPIAERRELALAMGADEATKDVPETAEFDLALEVSGDPSALDQAVRSVGYSGRVIVGSWYGTKPSELNLGGRFHRDRVTIESSQVSTIDPELRGRWSRKRRFDVAFEGLRRIDTDRLISHRIGFEEADRAYRALDRSPDRAIQVILTY